MMTDTIAGSPGCASPSLRPGSPEEMLRILTDLNPKMLDASASLAVQVEHVQWMIGHPASFSRELDSYYHDRMNGVRVGSRAEGRAA